jgi:ribosome-binding ATPase YchF (GTP1/OBG family)
MEIGIVGKPNVGKSTFFTAATLAPAEIANYPFTTVKPNRGVMYVRVPCPEKDFGVSCNPRQGRCENAVRFIGIEAIDVAGLVPDAHKGKGLGNEFLDDLRQASAFIHIIDATGKTDFEGNATSSHDPVKDVEFLESEITHWIKNIYTKGWHKRSKQIETDGEKIERALAERLTGLGIRDIDVLKALKKVDLSEKPSKWTEEQLLDLALAIRRVAKPMIIAANKADIAPPENVERLKAVEGATVIPTCAEFELALRRASKAGMIRYNPGDSGFEILQEEKLNDAQRKALKAISTWLDENKSTGVQTCIEKAVFDLLDLIPVYPVEDEGKLTDKDGNVLPDAYLVPAGTTSKDLAFKVHTDLGEGFIRAIDARTKRVIGADHELKAGDVVKIVSAK